MFLLYFVFVDQLELLKQGQDKAILDENEPVEDANMAEEDGKCCFVWVVFHFVFGVLRFVTCFTIPCVHVILVKLKATSSPSLEASILCNSLNKINVGIITYFISN